MKVGKDGKIEVDEISYDKDGKPINKTVRVVKDADGNESIYSFIFKYIILIIITIIIKSDCGNYY